MTRFGNVWPDTILPLAIALACAVAHIADSGTPWALLIAPVGGWTLWQVARAGERWVRG